MECKDLEVFILTYNRAEWLEIQLESICCQTVSGFKVCVLNNASTDNTVDVVKKMQKRYPNRDIEIITHSHNIGNFNNFKKTQELASRKYCAVFHDDDCVHPEYIERAMQCLYYHQDCVMASCHVEAFYNVTADNWSRKDGKYYFIDKEDFTFLMAQPNRPSFAASIYRTDVYKTCVYHSDVCGKIHDLAFMFDICSKGKSVILLDSYLRYRLSVEQDSAHPETGPFPEQVSSALFFISKTIKKRYCLSKYRLFHFAMFLKYAERSLSLISEKEFECMLIAKKVFTRIELFIIKNFGFFIKKITHSKVNSKFRSVLNS